jgi:hypothetical protein
MAGINGNHTWLIAEAEAAGIAAIDDHTPSENHDTIFFPQSHREFLPVEEILAYRVPPAHVAPSVAEGVVLKEEVILAFEVDEAVRIVSPVFLRREMDAGAVRLFISLGEVGKSKNYK